MPSVRVGQSAGQESWPKMNGEAGKPNYEDSKNDAVGRLDRRLEAAFVHVYLRGHIEPRLGSLAKRERKRRTKRTNGK